MKTRLLCAAATAYALFVLPMQAKTALFDCNPGLMASTNSYNVLSLNASITTGNVAVRDTTNALTGWTINISKGAAGDAGNSGSPHTGAWPSALVGFETNAVSDNFFLNGGGVLTTTLSGLDDTKVYDLLFYGSRAASGGMQTWHLVTGTGTVTNDVTHSANNNTSTVVWWKGISPVGGVIAFTLTNIDGVSAMNFGRVVEIVPGIALLDFGNASGLVTSSGGLTYNAPNFNGTTDTTGTVGLNDTASAATGWTINVTRTSALTSDAGFSGGGATYNGTLPDEVSGYDTSATRDNIFFNMGDQPSGELTVTIAGLDSSKLYDLLFYGSRSNLAGTQTWHLTAGRGTNTTDVSHSSVNNTMTIVNWTNVNPNNSGVIAFTISITVSSGTPVGALNFGRVAEVGFAKKGTLMSVY